MLLTSTWFNVTWCTVVDASILHCFVNSTLLSFTPFVGLKQSFHTYIQTILWENEALRTGLFHFSLFREEGSPWQATYHDLL